MISAADWDLLQAYLDDALPQAELHALEERLRGEPSLAEALVLLGREEAVLKEWACASRAAETCADSVVLRSRLRRALRIVSGAAALIILAVLAWLAFPERQPGPQPGPPLAMAHLEEVQGDVFVVPESGEPIPAKSGQALASGQKLRTQGDGSFAVLTFPDQSRLELGADTTIRLNSPAPAGQETAGREVFLEQGQVAADAAEQPDDPMIVQTPHAEARLSGGRSNVASLPNETRIEPEKGKIRVKRKSDGRSIEVQPGEYAIAGPNRQFTAKRSPVRIAETRAIVEGTGPVLSASFSADGSILATGCWDGTIKLWDVATGAQRQVIRAHAKPVRAVAFSPVCPLLASGNEERTLKFWDALTGEELTALKTGKAGIDCLAFSPDGTLLVAAGSAGRGGADIRFWDVTRHQEVASFVGHKGGTSTVAFSPDGRTLASAGRDSIVKLWNVPGRQLRQALTGHAGRVNAVAFSPDGSVLATGGADRKVRLWDAATGMEKPPLTGHRGEVRALEFAPDGKTLASVDNRITFWDMPAGRQLIAFKAHKRYVTAVHFSPDGKVLATTGWDKTIRLWDPARVAQTKKN